MVATAEAGRSIGRWKRQPQFLPRQTRLTVVPGWATLTAPSGARSGACEFWRADEFDATGYATAGKLGLGLIISSVCQRCFFRLPRQIGLIPRRTGRIAAFAHIRAHGRWRIGAPGSGSSINDRFSSVGFASLVLPHFSDRHLAGKSPVERRGVGNVPVSGPTGNF